MYCQSSLCSEGKQLQGEGGGFEKKNGNVILAAIFTEMVKPYKRAT
jgi:hypothetical protein